MKLVIAAAGLLVIFSAWQAAAQAEAIQATITSLDPNSRTATVDRVDEQGQIVSQNLQVRFSPNARFSGGLGFDDLQVGDEIEVEGQSTAAGFVEATSVSTQGALSPGGVLRSEGEDAGTVIGEQSSRAEQDLQADLGADDAASAGERAGFESQSGAGMGNAPADASGGFAESGRAASGAGSAGSVNQ